jgi:NADH-quinone oxidoreductase subunit N
MKLTLVSFLPLLPIGILGLTSVLVMLGIACKRHHAFSYRLTLLGLVGALVSIIGLGGFSADWLPTPVTGLLLVDRLANFYMALILLTTTACTMFAYHFFRHYSNNKEEVYLLLLIAAAGGLVLACSQHMAALFIGLELLSVPIYGLVAYTHERSRSLEAGIKYLVLSAAASAFMLFGMALVYAQTGSLSFDSLSMNPIIPLANPYMADIGVTMITLAFCFKLSLVPFHLWTPDVYQGAPAPIAAFLATVSKVAVIAVLVRFLVMLPEEFMSFLQPVFAIMAVVSIVVGNLLALRQINLKRMLAYSSIAHMGYLLIALIAGGTVAVETVNIYLLTYVATGVGAFGVISVVSRVSDEEDEDDEYHYQGLFWRNPHLGGVMTLMMLSLAGIPLTAGFIGKFYLFMTGVNTSSWVLLAALVVGSGLGLYYYLRVMVGLYLRVPTEQLANFTHIRQKGSFVLVILVAFFVLWLGVYPQPMLEFIHGLR